MVGQPLSLTARISVALNEIRSARTDADLAREIGWTSLLDRLLDHHIHLLSTYGKFRALEVLDPALAARLSVL